MAIITPSRATGELFGPVGPRTTFGWVTDCHNDPLKATDPSQGGKYYQHTINKLTDIAAIFNARNDLSFVFQNGDFIDGSQSVAAAQTDFASANAALNVNVPKYHQIGNHEMTQLTKAQILALTGQPGKWYSFVQGNVTFIVLDGSFTADDDNADLEVTSVSGASPYVSYIPPTQRQWLADTIAASPHPCVIFCHYPVYYVGAFSWGLTNAAAVRAILEAAGPGKVIGCVCGHLHDAFVKRINGILYITTQALVTGAYPTLNYSIISVYYGAAKTIKVISSGLNMSHIEAN